MFEKNTLKRVPGAAYDVSITLMPSLNYQVWNSSCLVNHGNLHPGSPDVPLHVLVPMGIPIPAVHSSWLVNA